jgi:hypothetical protein
MQKELSKEQDLANVKRIVKAKLADQFGYTYSIENNEQ